MNPDLFYVFGGFLVLLALGFSAIGIKRSEDFPSPRAMVVTIALFVFGVVTTTTWAVVSARDEQKHREEELAEHAAEAEGHGGEAEKPAEQEPPEEEPAPEGETPAEQPPPAGDAAVVELTSPEDGSLLYDQGQVRAAAGEVLLSYENPSPVPHNVAIEVDGETVSEGEVVSEGTSEASARLEPGQYIFFCSVPGHREAGMEGDLAVF